MKGGVCGFDSSRSKSSMLSDSYTQFLSNFCKVGYLGTLFFKVIKIPILGLSQPLLITLNRCGVKSERLGVIIKVVITVCFPN